MRKSRKDLEIVINTLLEKNNKNKDVLNGFTQRLEGKFYRGKAIRIFDKSIQLTLLSSEELYLVSKALVEAIDDTTQTKDEVVDEENKSQTSSCHIDIEEWFLDSEKRDATEIRLMNGEEEANPIVEFKNFIRKGTQDEWIGYVSYKDIRSMYEKGLLTYNQETQRKATIIERASGRLVTPTIFKSSVNSIARKMVEGKFYTNAITLNVTKTLREELFYNEKEKSLKVPINENTELAIVDGAHRILGIVKAVSTCPTLDNYIAVNVKNLTVDEAQEFIYQEALMNRQDLTQLRKSSTRDTYMEMAKTIARMGNKETNALFNRIGFLGSDVSECLCTGERFSVGLKDNFKDLYEKSDNNQLMNIVKYLVNFFNCIAETCHYEYKGDYKVLKKRSISTCSNFYVGMLAYARKLYGDEEWEDKLVAVLEDMSWDIRDKAWKERGVTVDNMSISTKKKLYNYFNSL